MKFKDRMFLAIAFIANVVILMKLVINCDEFDGVISFLLNYFKWAGVSVCTGLFINSLTKRLVVILFSILVKDFKSTLKYDRDINFIYHVAKYITCVIINTMVLIKLNVFICSMTNSLASFFTVLYLTCFFITSYMVYNKFEVIEKNYLAGN